MHNRVPNLIIQNSEQENVVPTVKPQSQTNSNKPLMLIDDIIIFNQTHSSLDSWDYVIIAISAVTSN